MLDRKTCLLPLHDFERSAAEVLLDLGPGAETTHPILHDLPADNQDRGSATFGLRGLSGGELQDEHLAFSCGVRGDRE